VVVMQKDCSVYVMQTFSNIQLGTNTVHRIHESFIYVCVCVCVCARACACMHVHLHTWCLHTCVCVCVGGGVGGRLRACVFMCVFIYKNIYGRFRSIIDHLQGKY